MVDSEVSPNFDRGTCDPGKSMEKGAELLIYSRHRTQTGVIDYCGEGWMTVGKVATCQCFQLNQHKQKLPAVLSGTDKLWGSSLMGQAVSLEEGIQLPVRQSTQTHVLYSRYARRFRAC